MAGIGSALGLAGALVLAQVMRSLLFEVSPSDPLTLGVVVLVLTACALLAAWLPARRAMTFDPMVALRAE